MIEMVVVVEGRMGLMMLLNILLWDLNGGGDDGDVRKRLRYERILFVFFDFV